MSEPKTDELWFVMDGRAVFDTDRASVLWSAGSKRPSKKELAEDFGGMDACLCVHRNGSLEYVEGIP